METGQAGAHLLDVGEEEADEIDADEGDLAPAVGQDDGAGLERVVDPGGLAVLAEAGDVDRDVTADRRRDVRLGEPDLQPRLPRFEGRPNHASHETKADNKPP